MNPKTKFELLVREVRKYEKRFTLATECDSGTTYCQRGLSQQSNGKLSFYRDHAKRRITQSTEFAE